MNKTNKYIRTAFGNTNAGIATNSPSQYINRQRQYMANRTNRFVADRAYLSSDYVNAEVQGLSENFYDWTNIDIRLADVVNMTASSTRKVDDYKEVLFPDIKMTIFPIGAKLKTMGSTWIAINPSNLSGVNANCLIARCNATYNSYDHYGNVVVEPIVVEKQSMLGNDNETPENLVMMDGYFNVIAQNNDNTKKLGHNKRIILGNKPYQITGFTDFMQEFTGERESNHLLNFTVRIVEPTKDDDITENFIAEGNTYSFSAKIIGQNNLIKWQTAQLQALFLLNGETVIASEAYPQTWEWTSSDNSVATVDGNGVVATVASGNADITAVLSENPNISATISLVIEETETPARVAFDGLTQAEISQFESAVYSATYYLNGMATSEEVLWSFSGADESSYAVTVNGNTVEVFCNYPSKRTLVITASHNDSSASVNVELVGY